MQPFGAASCVIGLCAVSTDQGVFWQGSIQVQGSGPRKNWEQVLGDKTRHEGCWQVPVEVLVRLQKGQTA